MYFKFLFLAFFILLNLPLKALNYYWVGGAGKWSEYNLHWATSSGGSSFYGQVPSPLDNVFIDGNSFSQVKDTIELDQTVITCNSLTFSTGNTKISLTGGTPASSLNIYGSLTLAPAVTIDYAGTLIFKSGVSGNTIKQNGGVFTTPLNSGKIEFNGPAGSWTLLDSLSLPTIIFTNGNLNGTGKKISCEEFLSSDPNTRTLNFTNATVYIGLNWDLNTANLTGIFTGSTIEFSSCFRVRSYPGALNFNTIVVSGNYGNEIDLNGNITKLDIRPEVDGFRMDGDVIVDDFSSLSPYLIFTGNIYLKKSTFKNLTDMGLGGNLQLDVTDLAGGDCKKFLTITGGPAIITKTSGVLALNFVIMKDITAQGGAIFSGQQVIDLGGNSGWNISLYSQANMYWIGGAGDWSDGNHWSFSSGGAPVNCVPTQYNNAVFDSHSLVSNGQIVNVPYGAVCKSLDCSSSTYTPVFANGSFNLYGSLILRPGLNLAGISEIQFLAGTYGNSIDFAHNAFPGRIFLEGNGGWTLQDSVYCNYFFYNTGSLNTNGKKINCSDFDSQSFPGNRVLTLGSSDITVRTGSLLMSSVGLTLNAGTSTLNIYQGGVDLGFNLSYYNMNIFSPAGTGIGGDNLIFNNVYLASQASIQGSITYDTLSLEEGQGFTVREGTTQTLNEIVINHNKCLSTEIICTTGNTASIVKPSGTLNLDFITLRHIAASGGAVFNASNCNDQGGNTGWNITALTSLTYYWIRGTGNWTDKQHWSLSSGGTPAPCVPNSSCDVIFDENSFSAPMQIVHLDLNEVACRSMVWKNLNSPAVLNGSILTVGGDLKLDSSVIIQLGFINLSPLVSSSVTTAGVVMPWVNLEGPGSYSFEDDYFSNGYFIIDNGDSIRFNHITLHSSDFYFRNQGPLVLDLDSSTFYIGQLGVNNGSSIQTISQGAYLYCPFYRIDSPVLWNFPFNILQGGGGNVNNVHFNKVEVDRGSDIQLYFSASHVDEFVSVADKLSILGYNSRFDNADFFSTQTIVQTDFTIAHLKVEPGKTLKIESGKTLFIENELEAPGNSGFPIYLLSTVPGTQANISKPSGITCFDYLYISDINATGGATFIAGPHSSDVENNTGWNFSSSCIPFTASYDDPVCEGDMIKLHATDMGQGASYQWTGPAGFTSSVKDPVINNPNSWNSGMYQVTSGGKTSIVYVTVHSLPFPQIAFLYNNIMSLDANTNVYQWFKDGVYLPGAGSGRYCGAGGPGKYSALITSPEGCITNSDTLVLIDYSSFVVPVEPLFLNAQTMSAYQINLYWNDNSSNETGFVLERSLYPTSGFVIVDTTVADLTTYYDTGLNPNTTYYYRVRAINPIGSSPYVYSNATTLDGPIVIPPTIPPSTVSVVVPNLITPNGDGLNDAWEIKNLPSVHSVKIYNDLGIKIFESSEYRNDWGNASQSGIYYYILLYNKKEEKGWIQVIK
jgi:hypothetical protein